MTLIIMYHTGNIFDNREVNLISAITHRKLAEIMTQNCHSQYISHVIEHMQQQSRIILNAILSIMSNLVPEDQMDICILHTSRAIIPGVLPSENNIRYTPRDFVQDIARLHDFFTRYTKDLKIIQKFHVYYHFERSFPSWFSYRSRKQSKANIERYGSELIKQLYFYKQLGKYIFRLERMRCIIDNYMQLSEKSQKINQSKKKNDECAVRKTVSDINYFYNVINQEYQKYTKQLILPINPSQTRYNMLKAESFFKDLGHLRQTSKKIRELVTDNYSLVQNVGSSLTKFIQSPQQSKGDHNMVHNLVTILSVRIARQA
jgi:hypothetical protein